MDIKDWFIGLGGDWRELSNLLFEKDGMYVNIFPHLDSIRIEWKGFTFNIRKPLKKIKNTKDLMKVLHYILDHKDHIYYVWYKGFEVEDFVRVGLKEKNGKIYHRRHRNRRT